MRVSDLCLVPVPKKIVSRQGVFSTAGREYVRLAACDPQTLIPAVERLQWEATASPKVAKDDVALTIYVKEDPGIPVQGYKLTVGAKGIEITASSPSGAFYGACTLAQIVRQCGGEIPFLSIDDSPDFPARGVMLDISRDKVPTMETLYHLVDLLADWKINQVQLYTEHTFAYLAHPKVWEDASPMTGEEILALDRYCKDRFVELVPNQNSFGHMERWLKFDEYRPMAEAPNGCDTAWGHFPNPFSISPSDKRSLPFIDGLYDELLPHFSSRLFNVGCDETIDLGCGRSKDLCEKLGTGRVYMDFLLGIHKLVEKHGRTMMFWGDIIMHHPELIPELPEDTVALEWGYEADHPFKDHGRKFADSGVEFYVCPGTSSWCTISGRTENAIECLSHAAKDGLANGATGMLNTDWGDGGHWQPLPVSYLGFMAGAMGSWNAKPDLRDRLADRLSLHAFGDATGKIGKAFFDMGDLYRSFGKRTFNSTAQWQVLFRQDDPKVMEGLSAPEFRIFADRLAGIEASIAGDGMSGGDAEIVRAELAQLLRLLRLSVSVGELRLAEGGLDSVRDAVEEARRGHEYVWLLRNRPGGLSDSLSRLQSRS